MGFLQNRYTHPEIFQNKFIISGIFDFLYSKEGGKYLQCYLFFLTGSTTAGHSSLLADTCELVVYSILWTISVMQNFFFFYFFLLLL